MTKKLSALLCLFAFPTFARDLAETGDLAPITDLSTSAEVLKPKIRMPGDEQVEELLRQAEGVNATRAVQSTYQQQITPAAAPAGATLEMPEGTISGVQGTITVSPDAGG
jgi:hypothetical protein